MSEAWMNKQWMSALPILPKCTMPNTVALHCFNTKMAATWIKTITFIPPRWTLPRVTDQLHERVRYCLCLWPSRPGILLDGLIISWFRNLKLLSSYLPRQRNWPCVELPWQRLCHEVYCHLSTGMDSFLGATVCHILDTYRLNEKESQSYLKFLSITSKVKYDELLHLWEYQRTYKTKGGIGGTANLSWSHHWLKKHSIWVHFRPKALPVRGSEVSQCAVFWKKWVTEC